MSTLEYHLAELAIAKAKDDPRRVMPALPAQFGSILDLGCGAGQTLIACELPPEVFACGADIDEEALQYGRQISGQIHFVRAGGEALPFGAGRWWNAAPTCLLKHQLGTLYWTSSPPWASMYARNWWISVDESTERKTV